MLTLDRAHLMKILRTLPVLKTTPVRRMIRPVRTKNLRLRSAKQTSKSLSLRLLRSLSLMTKKVSIRIYSSAISRGTSMMNGSKENSRASVYLWVPESSLIVTVEGLEGKNTNNHSYK